jgi:hypothetical protein
MDNLTELLIDLQLNDIIIDKSFMELIYQFKYNQINDNQINDNQNINIYDDIYDGDSVVSTNVNYDKMMDYEDGIQ